MKGKLNITGFLLKGEDHPRCECKSAILRCYHCYKTEKEAKGEGGELVVYGGQIICAKCKDDPSINLSIMEGGM